MTNKKITMQQFLPQLFVLRHGETEWSDSGQHTGRADISLNSSGEQEARQLGKRIEGVSFQHVLVSPLQRAKQTCQLAGLGQKAETELDLIEWDNGDYEGRTHKEIESERPGCNLFRDGSPNGESPEQVSDRANRLIIRLKKLDGNIALFTHGHFGRVLGVRWIDLPVQFADRFLLQTASVSVLSYQHNSIEEPASSLWNSPTSQAQTELRTPVRVES